MKISANNPRIAQFVEWVQTNENDTWLNYLVIKGLNDHLAKYRTSGPFKRGVPIDTRILQLIHKFSPELSTTETGDFRWALMEFIRDNHLVKKAFKNYEEP